MPKTNDGTIQEITRKDATGKPKKILQARYQYFDGSGKRKSKTKDVTTRTEGKNWLKQIAREHEAKKDRFGQKSVDFLAFTIEIEPELKKRKSVTPVLTQLKHLRDHFGAMKLSEIELEHLQGYAEERRDEPIQFKHSTRTRSDATIAKELSLMQRIVKIAIERKQLTASPFDSKSKPLANAKSEERIAELSEEQEKKMLDACLIKDKFGISRANLRPIIITAIDSSMRKGEILKLKWRDVDFRAEVIRVRKETVKIDTAKTIPMTVRLKETLETLKPANANPNDFVFADCGDFKKAYATVCKYAGVKLTFHDLRHVAISRMVAKEIPLPIAMKISGHKEVKTFLRYLNPTDAELVAQIRKAA